VATQLIAVPPNTYNEQLMLFLHKCGPD